ncbi:HalOD1 output domain-containing protein [Halovivax cerinus]|uniref:HalOD1 output domain-containing protein n=1 Tax=Halovivax cerinus TaxID=1487865 RepID=A0ABD5NJX7_9EURY|nr:HalOD1 output domain-containing protein [Halovivax cerinus]
MNAIDDPPITTGVEPTTTTTSKHDWEHDESITVSIVDAVASLADIEPEHVTRLYERLDPDALESLFSPTNRSGDRNCGHLWIPLDEYGVTVYADGTIVVQALE